MEDEMAILQSRIKFAIEQLHSLSNEMVYHSHLCGKPMQVDWDDLQEVIDVLNGKTAI